MTLFIGKNRSKQKKKKRKKIILQRLQRISGENREGLLAAYVAAWSGFSAGAGVSSLLYFIQLRNFYIIVDFILYNLSGRACWRPTSPPGPASPPAPGVSLFGLKMRVFFKCF